MTRNAGKLCLRVGEAWVILGVSVDESWFFMVIHGP